MKHFSSEVLEKLQLLKFKKILEAYISLCCWEPRSADFLNFDMRYDVVDVMTYTVATICGLLNFVTPSIAVFH